MSIMHLINFWVSSRDVSERSAAVTTKAFRSFQTAADTELLLTGIQYRLAKFPTNLPACQLTQDQLRMQYSLTKPLAEKEPVKSELASYTAWLTDDINTDRGSGPAAAESTTNNLIKAVLGFLGYQHYFVKPAQLSIWNVLNGHSVAEYIAFHKLKGNTIGTLASQIASLRKVLKFLGTQATNPATRTHIDAEIKWLSILNSQLAHVMPRESPDVKLPEAHQVVRAIEALRRKALIAVPAVNSVVSLGVARLFHDALLACFCFGYLPPVRLICLRTLQHPSARGCLHKGCRNQNCTGNRLHVMPDGSSLQLHLSHFKVERK